MSYLIRKTHELTPFETALILKLWDIPEWSALSPSDFQQSFEHSEFHFLLGADEKVKALGRINFDFTLRISGKQYTFAEIGGLISAQEGKGYGSLLVQFLTENTKQRNLEAIGFCHGDLRPFYRKCRIPILEGKARNIMEHHGTDWVPSEDDDILIFHLSDENKEVLKGLSHEKNAYLISKE